MAQQCQTFYNSDDGTVQPTSRIGTKFLSTSQAAGKQITHWTVEMKADNSNSFDVFARIYDLSNSLVGTIGQKNNTDIDSSSFTSIVWSTTPVTMPAAGGYLVVEAESDAVRLRIRNDGTTSNSWFDDSEYTQYNKTTSTWSSPSTTNAKQCVSYTSATSSGTRLPPPPLVAYF